jgi:hypothetical protein
MQTRAEAGSSAVDIHDAVKSGNLSAANIDHKKFEALDFTKEMCLRKPSRSAKLNEWVIEKTVGGQVEPQLPMAARRKSGRQIYAANLHCPFCKLQFEFCHVTE